jgi:ribosomal-protein-alanine N-acetyltransferase
MTRFHIMSRMPAQSRPHIRPLTTYDLDAVIAIEQASFSTPWCSEHFQHEIHALHSFPFVAESNGMIVGYVCLMSLFEEAQILDIAVAPEQRGRGIARLLMDQAIKVAREKDAEVLALEVRASNITAIALYEKCGFVRTGLRLKYYEGVDDAVMMEKKLM